MEIFGIPAHPLIVHAAVVLLPMTALGLVVAAFNRRFAKWGAVALLLLALGSLASVGLAQRSGEALEDDVKETKLLDEHTEMGESVLPWAIALVCVAGVGFARSRSFHPTLEKRSVAAGLAVVSLVVGVGSVATIYRVGHSGAKSVWHDTVDSGSKGG